MSNLDKLTQWINLGSGSRGWWILSIKSNPRLIIPTQITAWRGAIDLVSHRKKVILIMVLCIFKIIRKKPDIVAHDSTRLDFYLRDVWPDQKLNYVIYVGTPSFFQKYTVQCQDEYGVVIGYIKIPESTGALCSISNENKTLRSLSEVFHDERFYPGLLKDAEGISVHSTRSTHGYKKISSDLISGILKSTFSIGRYDGAWRDSMARSQIEKSVEILHDHQEITDILNYGLNYLDGMWEDSVEFGLMHGDFVAWNMKSSDCGFIFDWEWSGVNVKFHDIFHFLWFPILLSSKKIDREEYLKCLESDLFLIFENSESSQRVREYGYCYLLWRLAFYGSSCVKNGNDLNNFHAISKLKDLCANDSWITGYKIE